MAVALYFVLFGRNEVADWVEIRDKLRGFRRSDSRSVLGAFKMVAIVAYSLVGFLFTLVLWLLAVGFIFGFVTAMGAGNN